MGLSRAQMMAADGRCRLSLRLPMGLCAARAAGWWVLKRLEDAVRDQDRVLGVIRGTAVDQDGRSSGLTAPNGPSQEDVIRAALKDA